MSIAQVIRNCEPTHLGWIEIEDDADNMWRYVFKQPAPGATLVHINADFNLQQPITLTLAADGKANLRQGGPGLPKICIVRLPLPASPGASALSGFITNCEYEHSE